MQELEKILKEIDQYIAAYKKPPMGMEVEGTVDLLEKCRSVICKYMGGKDSNVPTNDGWIPVEERLQEVGEYVLGTNQYDEVLVYHYGWNSPHSKKMFFHLCGAAVDITAWRPLPEPYQGKKP